MNQEAGISIIDLAGRTVAVRNLKGTSGVFSWNAGENPAGVYFIRMTTESGERLQKRIVVVR